MKVTKTLRLDAEASAVLEELSRRYSVSQGDVVSIVLVGLKSEIESLLASLKRGGVVESGDASSSVSGSGVKQGGDDVLRAIVESEEPLLSLDYY
ncbi:MAG: hypothetical protein QW320_06530 [Ignisphaera sp.]|uniref:hypothetical protein n=1 Tax=Thermofilum sp. TaxID=1961369 RepID=UPI0031692D90